MSKKKKRKMGRAKLPGGPRTVRQTVIFHTTEFAHIEKVTNDPGPWMRELAIRTAKEQAA
jgi:hypothetical protein